MSFSEESEKDGEREKNFSFLYTLTLKSEVIGFFFFYKPPQNFNFEFTGQPLCSKSRKWKT